MLFFFFFGIGKEIQIRQDTVFQVLQKNLIISFYRFQLPSSFSLFGFSIDFRKKAKKRKSKIQKKYEK